MRKLMGIATAAALAFTAGAALADEVTGKISNIDLVKNTFNVGETPFQWASENTMGVKLQDLKEGDEVKVQYDMNQDGTNTVTDLEKVKK